MNPKLSMEQRLIRNEERKIYKHNWYMARRELESEKRKIRHIINREEENERSRRYQKNNPDKFRKSRKKYRATERGKLWAVVHEHNRRCLGKIEIEVALELKKEYGGICPYCNKPIKTGTIDHIIPVARGGNNSCSNLVWCCKSCNSSKNKRQLIEWRVAKVGALCLN